MHANRPVSGFSRVLASLNCDGRFGLALLAACGLLRSEEHTSELQSRLHLVCRLLLEKKKKIQYQYIHYSMRRDTANRTAMRSRSTCPHNPGTCSLLQSVHPRACCLYTRSVWSSQARV